MADDLINFIIDGSSERRGAIPADAFLNKLRQLITTIYSFERVFSDKPKRQIELEIVDLARSSPARVAMRARSQAQGYLPEPPLRWTFDQLDRLYTGRPIDRRIPQPVIDNVIDLASARAARLPEIGLLRVSYGEHAIPIDQTLEDRARAARAQAQAETRPPWRPGVSRGRMFGELRGVMDFSGERQFYIMPPSGPERVQCVFTEELRHRINECLFNVVRVSGFLHYDGNSAFPYLLEAQQIDTVDEPTAHLSDIRGIFRDMEPPEPFEDLM